MDRLKGAGRRMAAAASPARAGVPGPLRRQCCCPAGSDLLPSDPPALTIALHLDHGVVTHVGRRELTAHSSAVFEDHLRRLSSL
ncbi:hypothetical protein GN956_G15748 [Arapaima gigas]